MIFGGGEKFMISGNLINDFRLSFLPESMRWLVVHGRVDEAERVANLVARYNRVEPPSDVRARLQAVADEERRGKQNVIKYSYIDVFRGKTMIKTTVCSGFVW